VSGKYDSMAASMIPGSHSYITRGHDLRLHKSRAKYDLRKYFFSNRIVNIWNSLPDHVVIADTVNCFKSRLDKFWANQELMYNFRSENHGTGSRSEVIHLVIHLVRPLPVWRRVTWRIVGLLVHEKVDLSVSHYCWSPALNKLSDFADTTSDGRPFHLFMTLSEKVECPWPTSWRFFSLNWWPLVRRSVLNSKIWLLV